MGSLDYSILPEDEELAQQMNALGLPLSFNTNKEVYVFYYINIWAKTLFFNRLNLSLNGTELRLVISIEFDH